MHDNSDGAILAPGGWCPFIYLYIYIYIYINFSNFFNKFALFPSHSQNKNKK